MSSPSDRSELEQLIGAARLDEYDEVFERLAHGELTVDEQAQLRDSPDAEVRRLYALFRPLDEQAKQRFDAELTRSVGRAETHAGSAAVVRSPFVKTKRRAGVRFALVAGLAIAASVGTVIYFKSAASEPSESTLRIDFRPGGYEGNGPQYLGDAEEKPVASQRMWLPEDACVPLYVDPIGPGKAPQSIKLFWVQARSVTSWNVAFERTPGGVLKTTGCQPLPGIASGDWSLVMVYGQEGALLEEDQILHALEGRLIPKRGVKIHVQQIRIVSTRHGRQQP